MRFLVNVQVHFHFKDSNLPDSTSSYVYLLFKSIWYRCFVLCCSPLSTQVSIMPNR